MIQSKVLNRFLYHRQTMKIVRFFKTYFFDPYALKSYSQEGEDMILKRIFENQTTGFYVDVGAHHPKRFSNTYYFYKKGWRGINIDAMPGSMKPFKKLRKRDINIETAVSEEQKELIYYIFNDQALNGFSKKLSENHNTGKYYIVSKINLKTSTLEEILSKYLPEKQQIDFLSVDVESLDFQVLKSNNWEQYRPKVVLVEAFQSMLENISNDEAYQFLKAKEYLLYAKTVNTMIFISDLTLIYQ